MRTRLTADQRKAVIMHEAVKLMREYGEVDMVLLSARSRCVRSNIMHHFGSVDEVRRRAKNLIDTARE